MLMLFGCQDAATSGSGLCASETRQSGCVVCDGGTCEPQPCPACRKCVEDCDCERGLVCLGDPNGFCGEVATVESCPRHEVVRVTFAVSGGFIQPAPNPRAELDLQQRTAQVFANRFYPDGGYSSELIGTAPVTDELANLWLAAGNSCIDWNTRPYRLAELCTADTNTLSIGLYAADTASAVYAFEWGIAFRPSKAFVPAMDRTSKLISAVFADAGYP